MCSDWGVWLSLVKILQSELLGQSRPTVRCVQIASVTWSDYRHVILYNGSGFMPVKRCRKPCPEKLPPRYPLNKYKQTRIMHGFLVFLQFYNT